MIFLQLSAGEAVFVGDTLRGLGLPGAIIIVLMAVVTAMGTAIAFMWKHSNKVYGYRLTERDVLNKALTDTGGVLASLAKASEERNDLTEEQAELIEKQGQAFELLKITILSQYETIRTNHAATAQTIGSLADAVRQLTSMVQENRNQYGAQIEAMRQSIANATSETKENNRLTLQGLMVEVRQLLGDVTIVRRRKSP